MKVILPALAASMIVFPACVGSASSGEGASAHAKVVAGPTCQSGDPERLCVALKYVSYNDSNGKSVVTQAQAADNVVKINKAWDQCGIGFQVEDYSAINPADMGLTYDTANMSELDSIRTALRANDKLLIVTTGEWDRNGTLGNTGANAWTTMPGDNLDGAVLEAEVSGFPLIIAHEIGHYLNLDHVSDTSDMMNPVIYDDSKKLTSDQCASAREAITHYWGAMKRS
jgi:hypothetical protein